MNESSTTLSVEEMIVIRRALEAYHVYLMALTDGSNPTESSLNELRRIESLFAKLGQMQTT